MKSESTHLWPPTASNAPPSPASEETLDLGRVFSALGRRALLIAAITLAVGAVAGARAKLSPTSYRANFEILIQPPTGEAQVAVNLTGLIPQRNDSLLTLEDQFKILTSPGGLQPVVDQAQAEGLGGCASVGPSLPMDASERCYQALRQSLTIQNNAPASRIFSAQIEGQSPQEVQRLADLVAQRFLDYGLESRQRDIQQGIDFLDSKLPDVRAQVDRLQLQLEQLRQTNNIITPEDRGSQLTGQIGNFEAEYLEVLIELDGTLKLYEGLQQQLTQQPPDQAVSPVLSDNSRYQALVQNLLELDNEIAAASTLFLDGSPDLDVLKEQRQNLLRLLAREGRNAQQELSLQIEGLATREAALGQTLAGLNVEVDSLAAIARQFTDLDRELTIATENLSQLLARRETLEIEAAQRELPWELITPPTLTSSNASLPNNVGLGLVLGLLLGVGVALLLDTQDDVLHSPRDLKRITPVPILGLIPHPEGVERGSDESPLLTLYRPTTAGSNGSSRTALDPGLVPFDGLHGFKESFRSLVANLQRIASEQPVRSLVISAADDQVADATTAAYLAWAAAEMGSRVLL